MAKILPVLIMLVGLAVGIGAGLLLRPAPLDELAAVEECSTTDSNPDANAPEAGAHGATPNEDTAASDCLPADSANNDTSSSHGTETPDNVQYVKLNKQFVVPVLRDSKVSSLVIMSLSIEVDPSISDLIFEKEPKLRDELLRAMFLHANSGGFDGEFTGGEAMNDLKGSLLQAAQRVIDGSVYSVLITDILRQDV